MNVQLTSAWGVWGPPTMPIALFPATPGWGRALTTLFSNVTLMNCPAVEPSAPSSPAMNMA